MFTSNNSGFNNSQTSKLNIKDTVRAFLRNNFPPYSIVDSAKARIEYVTFAGNYLFSNAPKGTYFIQLKHRNSIQTWSKYGGQPYTLGSVLSYDFTSAAAQSFGSNMIQLNASPLRFGIFAVI